SLPRIDSLSSRIFILTIMPHLSTIEPPINLLAGRSTSGRNVVAADCCFRALDVGSGIGRVTNDVLIHLFHRVDLIEPIPRFIDRSRTLLSSTLRRLGSSTTASRHTRAVRLWCRPLQEFDPKLFTSNDLSLWRGDGTDRSHETLGDPKEGFNHDGLAYDLIWAQWTLGHLSDLELVEFFTKCKSCLRGAEDGRANGGYLVVKENVYQDQSDPDGDLVEFDDQDSSLTRSNKRFCRLFEESGLKLIRDEIQVGFNPELYQVKFYVLQ
ncbi:alpha-N-methyltransferase NTM1, partial [Phakopsora pachyrhizi]